MAVRQRYFMIIGIVAVYVSVIVIGIHFPSVNGFELGAKSHPRNGLWQRESVKNITDSKQRSAVRRGELLFTDTPLYAAKFTRARLSCASCHAEGGIQPFASPVVGISALFPMFSQRAGRQITLKDRIEECFVRSENGSPLDYESTEMNALVSYIEWLSQPHANSQPFIGRGLVDLPDLKPDPVHGSDIYFAQCAGCHGRNGEGEPYIFPPLWGDNSFNDGAGMNSIRKMAAFVQHNMPQNRMGILTPQDAYDVSAFIHNQPRPKFNPAYSKY